MKISRKKLIVILLILIAIGTITFILVQIGKTDFKNQDVFKQQLENTIIIEEGNNNNELRSELETKTFQSATFSNFTFKAFFITYPSDWLLNSELIQNNKKISVNKDNYYLRITQGNLGGEVCNSNDNEILPQEKSYDPSKIYTLESEIGQFIIFKYGQLGSGNESYIVCGPSYFENISTFNTLTTIGLLEVEMPRDLDQNIFNELKSIISSIRYAD